MRWRLYWPAECALALAFIGLGGAQVPPDSSPPRVTLNAGELEGTRFGNTRNDVAFLGVPYAAPPVGELRWKPPESVPRWSGTRKATKFGAACPQLSAGWLPYPAWSEDCLFLNVWTARLPAWPRRPVIVFFHGGSNRAGYSQLNPLGPALSTMGVVVVSANYRLGPLGFLAHPALTTESEHHSSGNYGLLDQIKALQWVRENITHFGGDPGRITVMGQSSGAVDICLLMTSPLAKGLFQAAILESGDCQSTLNEDIRIPISYNGISGTGEGAGEQLATDLGVADGPDALRKLRSVPVDTILKAWSRDPRIQFDAIVDGWVVPEQPTKIFVEGRQAHISVLVGSNADEATVFGHGPTTVAEYRRYLEEDTGRDAQEEFQAWPVSSDADVPEQYLKLQNDTFAYGAWSMAGAMTRVGKPAFLYLFIWTEAGKRARLGAYHGEELTFLSDSFPTTWGSSKDDDVFGEVMRTYWIQFAKTGNPNMSGFPNWPAYDPRSDQVLELGRSIRLTSVSPKLRVLERIMAPILANKPDETVHRSETNTHTD
jgi:para-nitrobenzyl esterase